MKRSKLVQITRQNKIAEVEFDSFADAMFADIWEKLSSPQILTQKLSNRVAENVITAFDEPVPECETCGGCCAAFSYVDIAPTDSVSIKDSWNIFGKGSNKDYLVDRFIKRTSDDFSCTALDGVIGEKVSCRIYKDRPLTCRNFEAGSDRCHAVRRAYGIEPFLNSMEMSEAIHLLKEFENEKKEDDKKIDTARIVENIETENLQVFVTLNDGSEHLIHTFNRNFETWFKSEFERLTLSKAKDLVANRKQIK